MRIGVVIACEEEFVAFIKLFPKYKTKKFGEFCVYIFSYAGKKLYCVKCGPTRINASILTQLLIDKFNVKLIINFGTCGGLKKRTKISSIYAVSRCTFWDIKPGFLDKGSFDLSGSLLDFVAKKFSVKKAFLVTGDSFVDENNKDYVCKNFSPDLCDMEGAAVVYAADKNKVKSVLFKVVSDDGNGQAWDQNVTSVSQILAKFIVDFLKEDLKRFI